MRLKELRSEKNLTLAQLANDLKTTPQVISRYERGEREPDLATLSVIAVYFGVSTDYLLGREDDFGNVAINADLSEEEKEILRTYRNLSPKQKETFTAFIKNYDTLMNK